ncbi:hypothetical protein ACEE21_14765 [Clostridium baratii]
MGEFIECAYFSDVDDMFDYAIGDLENYDNFEFRCRGERYKVRFFSDLVKVSNVEFIFNNIKFNVLDIEPIC